MHHNACGEGRFLNRQVTPIVKVDVHAPIFYFPKIIKVMNNIDAQYQALLKDIMLNGVKKKDRTGTGTISVFGRQIRHNMAEGFPLLTTKKMYWKGIVTELLWFLRGDTNIKYLLDNDCHIWDGDAYKRYWDSWFNNPEWKPTLEDCDEHLTPFTKEEFINKIKTDDDFAKKWGELGPIYGKQWRGWNAPHYYVTRSRSIDQITNLINDLKTNPDSRRLMVNAWNVGELDQMVLPPCHYGFQCYVRDGKYLSLMWSQRSVDTFLGLPFNIASYGLLLCILAELTNMVPDFLIGSLGDVHLYQNHWNQANEQYDRTHYALPKLRINSEFWNPENVLGDNYDAIIKGMQIDDFQIENYQSHPTIKAPLSN